MYFSYLQTGQSMNKMKVEQINSFCHTLAKLSNEIIQNLINNSNWFYSSKNFIMAICVQWSGEV